MPFTYAISQLFPAHLSLRKTWAIPAPFLALALLYLGISVFSGLCADVYPLGLPGRAPNLPVLLLGLPNGSPGTQDWPRPTDSSRFQLPCGWIWNTKELLIFFLMSVCLALANLYPPVSIGSSLEEGAGHSYSQNLLLKFSNFAVVECLYICKY